jgi:hypothetical protein
MMLRYIASSLLFLLCVSNSFAQPTYNSEKNIVELRTPILSGDTGWIKIYNGKHIEIGGLGMDKAKGKMIGLCGNNPSLGLMFLDSKLKLGAKVPKVTEVIRSTNTSESTKQTIAAGWVHSFLLKGDDAQDLMDLLLDNKAVGFSVRSGPACGETQYSTQGTVTINFETAGLERAMKRIK